MTKENTHPPVPAPRVKRSRMKAPAPPPPVPPPNTVAPKPPPPARKPKKCPPPPPKALISPNSSTEQSIFLEAKSDADNFEELKEGSFEILESHLRVKHKEEDNFNEPKQATDSYLEPTHDDGFQESVPSEIDDTLQSTETVEIQENWVSKHEVGCYDPDFSRNDIYMFSLSGSLHDNLTFNGNSMENNNDPNEGKEDYFELEEFHSPLPPKIVEEVWKISSDDLRLDQIPEETSSINEIIIPSIVEIIPSPAPSLEPSPVPSLVPSPAPSPVPSLPSSSPPSITNTDYLKFFTPLQFTPNVKKTPRPIIFNPMKNKESLSEFLETALESESKIINAVADTQKGSPKNEEKQPVQIEHEKYDSNGNLAEKNATLEDREVTGITSSFGENSNLPIQENLEPGERPRKKSVEESDGSLDEFADCENSFQEDRAETSTALGPLTITVDNVVDDFFGSIRESEPFSVAAISPREASADSIPQNFFEFTHDMLANDYTLIETHANAAVKRRLPKSEESLEKINEEPINEEDLPWAQFENNGATLSAEQQQVPLFEVDWGRLFAESPKQPEEDEESDDSSNEIGEQPFKKNEVPEGTIEESFRVGSDIVNLRLIPNAGKSVEMGSNVSREKGLNRRSVSSGHLDAPLPKASKGQGSHINNHITSQATTKLCGSLPNYLDSEDDPRNNNLTMNHLNMELDLQKMFPIRNGKQEPLLLPPPPLFHDQETDNSPEDEDILLSILPKYPFITKENIFEVLLSKGSRGLGLSVTGGIDCSNEPWPGIIRIKRLFPHQPAWQDGKLAPGDVLLEADGTRLTGLTNYEALEVLRTTLTEVKLKVCRPPAGAGLLSIEPEENESNIPVAPLRHSARKNSKADRSSDDSDADDEDDHGSSSKPCATGEFEFEMAKVDKSLGFTIRKEDDSRLGHYVLALVKEPAVSDGRLRPGDKIVAVNGVDISPLTHKEAVAYLRMCGDVVRLRLYRDPAQTPVSILSPDGFKTFPRTKPLLRKEAIDMLSDLAGKKLSSPHDTEKRRRASEEPALKTSMHYNTSPRRRKAKTPPSPAENTENRKPAKLLSLDLEKHASGLNIEINSIEGESSSRNSSRPVSLDLSTPSSIRKQKFQFMSPPFSGDDDDDDASVIAGLSPPNEYPGPSSLVSQPASMPPMNLEPQFIHRKPEYQSANLTAFQTSSPASSDQDIPQKMHQGNQGLLKWKGIMFTQDKNSPQSKAVTPVSTAKKTPILNLEDREGTVIVVELTRGWNSRLGFTLCSDKEGRTLIKDIYPDSVAFKDGRLKSGDHVVMVNDDNIEHLPTDEVIDLVRKIRGTVAITVIRADKEPQ